MTKTKTTAVLIRAGRPVAVCETARRGGDVVSYGFHIAGGELVAVGRAKISRAAKYLRDDELMMTLRPACINGGGGGAE